MPVRRSLWKTDKSKGEALKDLKPAEEKLAIKGSTPEDLLNEET